MPALISGQYNDYRAVYSSYISTYIDRDVKEISGAIDSLKFMDFITSAAALCGQMVNYKTISDAASIDQVTAKKLAWDFGEAGNCILSPPLFQQYAKAHGDETKALFL
ncbi:DUF4143 domain-containing protein [Lacrimispora xylanisolvens]|uniref:DUF4143 domain-containing protein n=1 Tax=Lacrimispora xylanisolvens TaxID=384636 RepID=UPI003D9C8FBE